VKTLVCPWGIFGHGNIGDEAMLQGFAKLVSSYRVIVASANPFHDAQVAPSLEYFERSKPVPSGDLYVIVGDTPITDQQGSWPLDEIVNLVKRYQPIVLCGIGSEPLKTAHSKEKVTFLAQHVERWSVRSSRDCERLLSLGVPKEKIKVAADLVWLLEPAPVSSVLLPVEAPYIGVNITNESWVLAQNPQLFAVLAEYLDFMVEKANYRILFFSNEVRECTWADSTAISLIQKQMKHVERSHIIPNTYRTPSEMCSLIGRCEFVIGARYHFCSFAALQGVPPIILGRQPKLKDLKHDLAWKCYLDIDMVSFDGLVTMSNMLNQNSEAWMRQLKDSIVFLRQQAEFNLWPISGGG